MHGDAITTSSCHSSLSGTLKTPARSRGDFGRNVSDKYQILQMYALIWIIHTSPSVYF